MRKVVAKPATIERAIEANQKNIRSLGRIDAKEFVTCRNSRIGLIEHNYEIDKKLKALLGRFQEQIDFKHPDTD